MARGKNPERQRPAAPAHVQPTSSAGVQQAGVGSARHDVSLLTADDLFLFNEGSHLRLYDRLGAHPLAMDGVPGTVFAVWAPNADYVAVLGDFNAWEAGAHPLQQREHSGIWEGFIPGVGPGAHYKYLVAAPHGGYRAEKADPFAFAAEVSPRSASVVADLAYRWNDEDWQTQRAARNALDAPWSIYECHLGSWMRVPEEGNRSLTYQELAVRLADYLEEMSYTHVELLPIMEHPFYGSWGYQVTGYFAPSSRYGSPTDFMALVDHLHQRGIGVILDWVPSHFATDGHGLAIFDGTHLYEHSDVRQGFHPDWGSAIFNYGRHEVQSFLLSNALFWLDVYHVDALRVDAVASMLYLDYSRKEGEWIPNPRGGRENLEAIAFLRRFNEEVYRHLPHAQTIAEESTAWGMVSRPTYVGGLGFGMKWDMGWMHDTLRYLSRDPVHRRFHHNDLTFRGLYLGHENFVLPLSHDEVVHGKRSLLGKMPGDPWQQRANLRLLLASMFVQPGKKLLFMGGEFGQLREWNHDVSLDWHLLQLPEHRDLQRFARDLNHLYRAEPALWQRDFEPGGFEWIDANDSEQSVLSLLRRGRRAEDTIVALLNYTPVPRHGYRVGLPSGGEWRELLNSDATEYGGSGLGNLGAVQAENLPWHGRPCSAAVTVPPLGAVLLKPASD